MTVLARCLSLNQPNSPEREVIHQRIEKELATNPENLDLLLAMGKYHQVMGHWALGVELNQRALLVSPNQVQALSQLALCQSHGADSLSQSRAFANINQGLRLAGPRADLLAIKGMGYFYTGHPAEGMDLLQVAASTIRPNPIHQFYYALALAEINELDLAREEWGRINQEKLLLLLNGDLRQRHKLLAKKLEKS